MNLLNFNRNGVFQKTYDQERSNRKKIEYEVPGFVIQIYDNPENNSIFYVPECKVPYHLVFKKSKKCRKKLIQNSEEIPKKIFRIEELNILLKSYCYDQIYELIESFNLSETESIVLILFDLLNLFPFIPLFFDDEITESHITENQNIIVDHKIFGRLLFISDELTTDNIQSLVKRCELEAKQNLTKIEPSLKVSLNVFNLRSRISIDAPPITTHNYDIIIRRQKVSPFTLKDLINLEMITPVQARFISSLILQRKNIAIVGEPYAGKTTLANAILLELPKIWKIVIIEDIDEIYIPANFINVTKILVPPIESSHTYTSKANEIIKLLHRSPDYVFIGEVQSKSHTNALFEAYGAGIKCIHTVHSDSAENLIRRWIFAHSINPEYLGSLDYLIVLSRKFINNKIIRSVSKIYTIKIKNKKIQLFSLELTPIKNSIRSTENPTNLETSFSYKLNPEEVISI